MTRGIRNNNPGNIRHGTVTWLGQAKDQTDPGFVQFVSSEYGIRALAVILHNYQARDGIKTIEGAIDRWAPPAENDTVAYVNAVCRATNCQANVPVDFDDIMPQLVKAIIQHENGEQPYTEDVIDQGISLAGIKWQTKSTPVAELAEPAGPPPQPSQAEPSSEAPSPKSLWQRLSTSLKSKSTNQQDTQSQSSHSPSLPTSSPMVGESDQLQTFVKEMNMTTTTAEAAAAVPSLLQLLENSALLAFGPALIAFLQATTAAAGDPFKEVAALSALRGAIVGALPGVESTVIAQVDSNLIAKIQALLAKAQTPPT